MPAMPWKSFGKIDSEREYLALLTSLPLRSRWRIPWVLIHTRRIVAQLQQTPGLVGFSMYARPLRRDFWTLSVWESEAALQTFVGKGAHTITMRAVAPHMGPTRFIRWRMRGAELPPKWADAFARQSKSG